MLILFLVALTNALDIQVVKDYPTTFENFQIVSRNSANESIFGYSSTHVCLTGQSQKGLYAFLQNINTLERTAPYSLKFAIENPYEKVQNCFFFKEHSYIITKNLFTNFTTIIKGHNIKVFHIDYDLIRYDYILNKLYFVQQNKLYEMSNFEDFDHVITIEQANLKPLSDLMITDGVIFQISDGQVYKDTVYIGKINSDYFYFQLFPLYRAIISRNSVILVCVCITTVVIISIFCR